MDKVRKFDKELEKINSNAFLGQKVISYLFCGMGLICMLIPFETGEDCQMQKVLIFLIFCFLETSVYNNLEPYMRVREKDKYVSIYEKLSFMPVTKTEIRKVRCAYLKRFCIRLSIAAFVLQETVSLLNHSFGLLSVVYVIVMMLLVWITGLIYLHTS